MLDPWLTHWSHLSCACWLTIRPHSDQTRPWWLVARLKCDWCCIKNYFVLLSKLSCCHWVLASVQAFFLPSQTCGLKTCFDNSRYIIELPTKPARSLSCQREFVVTKLVRFTVVWMNYIIHCCNLWIHLYKLPCWLANALGWSGNIWFGWLTKLLLPFPVPRWVLHSLHHLHCPWFSVPHGLNLDFHLSDLLCLASSPRTSCPPPIHNSTALSECVVYWEFRKACVWYMVYDFGVLHGDSFLSCSCTVIGPQCAMIVVFAVLPVQVLVTLIVCTKDYLQVSSITWWCRGVLVFGAGNWHFLISFILLQYNVGWVRCQLCLVSTVASF